VLVATDLGGRGLDIKGISAAISYDAPKNIS
jgi:superfamily II DNA/RNA helicase